MGVDLGLERSGSSDVLREARDFLIENEALFSSKVDFNCIDEVVDKKGALYYRTLDLARRLNNYANGLIRSCGDTSLLPEITQIINVLNLIANNSCYHSSFDSIENEDVDVSIRLPKRLSVQMNKVLGFRMGVAGARLDRSAKAGDDLMGVPIQRTGPPKYYDVLHLNGCYKGDTRQARVFGHLGWVMVNLPTYADLDTRHSMARKWDGHEIDAQVLGVRQEVLNVDEKALSMTLISRTNPRRGDGFTLENFRIDGGDCASLIKDRRVLIKNLIEGRDTGFFASN